MLVNAGSFKALDRMRGGAFILLAHIFLASRVQGVQYLKREKRQGVNDIDGEDSLYSSSKLEDESHLKRFLTENMNSGSGLDKMGEENWERIFRRFFPKTVEEAEPAVPVLLGPSLTRDIHRQSNRLEIGTLSNSTKQFSINSIDKTIQKSIVNKTSSEKGFMQYSKNLTTNYDKYKPLSKSKIQFSESKMQHVGTHVDAKKDQWMSFHTTNKTKLQFNHSSILDVQDDVEDVSMKSFDRLLQLQNSTQVSNAMEALNNSYDNLFSGSSSGSAGGSASGSGSGGDVSEEEGARALQPGHNLFKDRNNQTDQQNGSALHSQYLSKSNGSSINSLSFEDQAYENLLASSSLKTLRANISDGEGHTTLNVTDKTNKKNSLYQSNHTNSKLNSSESLESKLERSILENQESTSALFPTKEEMSYFPDSTTFESTSDLYQDVRDEDNGATESGHHSSDSPIKERRELIDQRSSMATLVRQLALLDPNDDSVPAEDQFSKRSPEELHEKADSKHGENMISSTNTSSVEEVVDVRKRSVDDDDNEDGYRPRRSKTSLYDTFEVDNLASENTHGEHKRKAEYEGYFDTFSEIPPTGLNIRKPNFPTSSRDEKSFINRPVLISDDDPNADRLMADTGKEEKQDEPAKDKHEKKIVKKMRDIITDAMAINAGYKKSLVPSTKKKHQRNVHKKQKIAGYWTGIGSKPLFVPERETSDDSTSGDFNAPDTTMFDENYNSPPATLRPSVSSVRVKNTRRDKKKVLGKDFVKDHKRSSLYNEMKSNFLLRNQRSLQKARRLIKEPEEKYTDSNGKANVIIAFEDVREMVPRHFHSFEEEDAPSFYLESEKRLAKSVEEDLAMLPIRQREDTVGKLITSRSSVRSIIPEEEPEPKPEIDIPFLTDNFKSSSRKRSTVEAPTIRTVSMAYHMNKDETGKDFSTRSFADIPEEEKSFLHVKRAPNEDGYLGCFIDVIHPDRDLPVRAGIPFVTPNNCRSACKRTGYYYAGLQYGYLCFCGNTYGRYDMAPETECSHTCSGDGNKTCGGYWRNAIFDTAGAPDESNEGPIPFYLPPKSTPDLPAPKLVQETQDKVAPTTQMQPTNPPQVIAPPPTPQPNSVPVNNVTQPTFFLPPSNDKVPPPSPPLQAPSLNSNRVKFIKIADITKNGTTILQPGVKLLAKSIIPHLSQIQLISTSPIQSQAVAGREVINTDVVKKSVIPQPLQTHPGIGGQVMFNDPRAVIKETTSDDAIKKDTVLTHWAYIHPQSRNQIIPTLMPHPTRPLKVQVDTRVYKGEIRLRQNWFDDFRDENSPKYQILAGNVEQALKHIHENDTDFLGAKVLSFREGISNSNPSTAEKVICQFTVTFKQDAISPDAKLLEFTRSHGNKLDDMPVYGNTLMLSEYHFDPNNPRQPFLSPSNISLDVRNKVPSPAVPVVSQNFGANIPKAPEEKVSKRLDEHPYVLQGTYAFNAAPPTQQNFQTTSFQTKGMKDLTSYLKNQNSPAVASLVSASKPVPLQIPTNTTSQTMSTVNYTKLPVLSQATTQNSTAQVQPKKKVPYILRLFFWKDMLARKKRAAQTIASRRRLQRRKRQDVTESDTLEVPNTLPEGEQKGRRRKKTRRKTKDLSVEKELHRAKRS